jgi:NADH-quinone oxidoreductase subunit M
MTDFPILSLMLLVPLVAGVICLLVSAQAARTVALIATLIDFVLGVVLWMNFDVGGAQWQFQESVPLFAGFSWALGH